jgi:hypothetical protein
VGAVLRRFSFNRTSTAPRAEALQALQEQQQEEEEAEQEVSGGGVPKVATPRAAARAAQAAAGRDPDTTDAVPVSGVGAGSGGDAGGSRGSAMSVGPPGAASRQAERSVHSFDIAGRLVLLGSATVP